MTVEGLDQLAFGDGAIEVCVDDRKVREIGLH